MFLLTAWSLFGLKALTGLRLHVNPGNLALGEGEVRKSTQRSIAFAFGVVFLSIILIVALVEPNPTPFQYTVFRIVLALAAGGVAAMIPGFIQAEVGTWLRAGGAMAVFVVVYFASPAEITGVEIKTRQEKEIEKPLFSSSADLSTQPRPTFSLFSTAYAQGNKSRTGYIETLTIDSNHQFSPDMLGSRYGEIVIDGVEIEMPTGATIAANRIEGKRGGAIVGSEFSVVAGQISNLTIDVSADRSSSINGGDVRLYIKKITNSRLLANGSDGADGDKGNDGTNGTDGAAGRAGDCRGFGKYKMATAGADGRNGGDGQPGGNGAIGGNGGSIFLTTVVAPVSTVVDVGGGSGGSGGAGGAAGAGGRGGPGGAGCTDIGGTQATKSSGRPGLPGKPGEQGQDGPDGAVGEYRLLIVESFDDLIAKMEGIATDRLHEVLSSE